jgi:peptide/nickel transport system permease protein
MMAETTIDPPTPRPPEPTATEPPDAMPTADTANPRPRPKALLRNAVGAALREPGLVIAVLVLLLILGWVVAPGLFAARGPLTVNPAHALEPPGSAAWFGTDYLGRDVYSRVVYGAALSLGAPLIAVGVALVSGTAIGLAAGTLGGWADALLMRLMDVLLAIPSILVSLAVVTALGFGTLNIAVAVGLAGVAGFARVARAQVLAVNREPYVEAAYATGVRRRTVVLTHVLPNAGGPVLALAALETGTAILSVSALSFLGFGAQPPTPEWGAMVSDGQNYLATSWWLTAMPGLAIAAVTLSVNRLARAIAHRRPL